MKFKLVELKCTARVTKSMFQLKAEFKVIKLALASKASNGIRLVKMRVKQ